MSDAEGKSSNGGRLSPEDWIRAAVAGLREEGPPGARVTRLAKRLGVTPGSFYWHFQDKETFRDGVIEHWRKEMLAGAVAAVQGAGLGAERIRALPDILMARGLPEFDDAIRAWAPEDPVVAEALAKADDFRIRRAAGFLEDAGIGPDDAYLFSRTIIWGFLGSKGDDLELRMRAFKRLIEAMLATAAPSRGQASGAGTR